VVTLERRSLVGLVEEGKRYHVTIENVLWSEEVWLVWSRRVRGITLR
jgi:hypothetical protein